MLEQQRQSKIIKKLEADGWFVVKLIKTSVNGIPDLMALKDKKAIFIEVKQPSGLLSEIQKFRIKQLQNLGFECKVWTDYEKEYDKARNN